MSATAVPIPPTPSSTKTKIWLGVVAALVAGGALAWMGTDSASRNGTCGADAFSDAEGASAPELLPSGLRFQTVKAGNGSKPTDDDITLIKYKGTLPDGTVFDQNPQAPMPVKGVIPGFSEALKKMQAGGSYRVCIPPELGYGDKTQPGSPIPANATLRFEVDMMQFMPMAEFEAGMRAMQEQQGKQGPGGAPDGMPAAHP